MAIGISILVVAAKSAIVTQWDRIVRTATMKTVNVLANLALEGQSVMRVSVDFGDFLQGDVQVSN